MRTRFFFSQWHVLPRWIRRAFQRRRMRSLAGVGFFLVLGQQPVEAATINVDGATCTLIDAMNAANTDSAIGGCTTGRGADTLVLTAGSTQTLHSVNNSTYGATGLPVVSSLITIEGNGSTITRDSVAPTFRIVAIGKKGNLTLKATTVSGGQTMDEGGPHDANGGGIANISGTLTLEGCTVTGNSAYNSGGGVYSRIDGSDTVTLSNSTVSGNYAFYGGGVHNFTFDHSQVTLSNATISENAGGGMVNSISVSENGRIMLINTTITGNTADVGGGEFDSTFYTRNTSSGSSRMLLINTTITGNTAYEGAGMYSTNNDPSRMRLSGSLITGNTAQRGAEVVGLLTADAFNLFGHSGLTTAQAFADFTPGATDISATVDGTNPTALSAILDTTLQHNGGSTLTHNLVGNSPAIDAAGASCGLSADQRGFLRPVDGNGNTIAACDVGAVEFDSTADPCATAVSTQGCTVNGRANQSCAGTSGNDTIVGTSANDVIFGLGGNDVLRGQAGDDLLCSGEGDDVLIGGSGNDWLEGGANNDEVVGNEGSDTLKGDSGLDRLTGGAGEDLLDGGTDNDDLTGGPGTDICLNGEKLTACE